MHSLPEIRLRALEPADTDLLYRLENLDGGWTYGYSPAPLSRYQIWQYIKGYDAEPLSAGQLKLMIDNHEGQTVGCVDLYEIDSTNRRAKTGILIDPAHRRKGYGTQAVDAISRYCLDNLGLHQLCAEVSTDNHPSISLFTKAGFKTVASLPGWYRRGNDYIDALLLAKLL